MAHSNIGISSWKARLTAELAHDKRKSIVLGVLFVVAVLIVLRLAAGQAARPRPRAALGANTPAAYDPNTNSEDVPSPRLADDASAAGTEGGPPSPAPLITRDIFLPALELFPPERTSSTAKLTGGASAQMDSETKRRAILAQAQALSLQSTIISDAPMAIINGRVVRIGGKMNEFEVIEITAHACTVTKDGVKVTLEIIGQVPQDGALGDSSH